MSLFVSNVFAQELRGVETKISTYEGKEYAVGYKSYRDNWIAFGHSSLYLGFEFTNLNSVPVSVSVEIYHKGEKADKLIDTKEIVLKSRESYICKYPILKKYEDESSWGYVTSYSYDNDKNWEKCAERGLEIANEYYTKYKAYKLQ